MREAVGRAERNLALLGNELRTVTGDLFAAAAPHAQAMEAECDEAALAAEESARTALGAAVEALERCGELENRSGWWWELGHEDSAPPFLAGAGTTAEAQGRIRAVVTTWTGAASGWPSTPPKWRALPSTRPSCRRRRPRRQRRWAPTGANRLTSSD